MARAFPKYGIKARQSWMSQRSPDEISDEEKLILMMFKSDISEWAEPSEIGEHLADELYIINQPTCIQVIETVDVSLPRDQREQMTVSPKGTLKLILTDGDKTFIGIGKGKITHINPAAKPGLKIMLKPPLEMRYGVIFLSDDKIQVLGGISPAFVIARQQIFDPSSAPVKPPTPPPEPEPPSVRPSQITISSDSDGLSLSDEDDTVPPPADLSDFICESDDTQNDSISSISLSDDDDIVEIEKPLSVAELKSRRKSAGDSSSVEMVETSARISDFFDFRVKTTNSRKQFHSKCKLSDRTGDIFVMVTPFLLSRVAETSPGDWASASDEEKQAVSKKCRDYFMEMQPPLKLIQRADKGDELDGSSKYLLTE